jgi:plasmid maintenance system antidote protein VapI
MESYVRDKKVRFIAYHCDACPETGAPCYRVYLVFTNQLRFSTVGKLFPVSQASCVPVHGKLNHDAEYYSKQNSFTKLGVEPIQGKRKDVGDVVQRKKRRKISETEAARGLESEFETVDSLVGDVVQRKKRRKISETEAARGLESEFETVDSLLKNLSREYDLSSQEKDKILDVLKRQLETSKEETMEAQRISDELKKQLETSKALAEEDRKEAARIKTQLDIAAPAIIDQYRQAFILDCKRGPVGYYVSTGRILEELYVLQPPLRTEDKLVMQTNICGSVNKALKLARVHYHPDRQGKGGYWCKIMCTEIIKLLNCISEAARQYSTP